MRRYPVVGLALGGGGARGFAHIGVLKVFLEENIPFHVISGSSMGAVVGASYALLQDVEALEKKAREMVEKVPHLEQMGNLQQMPREQKQVLQRLFNFMKELYVLNLEATRKALIDRKAVLPILEDIFNHHTFADLKMPFAAVATDLRTGAEVVIRQGDLVPAIMASSAIPGIFEPVEWNGYLLVDGCVTSTVPVDAARELGADFVIAVNVEADIRREHFERGLDILFQVDDIRGAELNRLKLAKADVVIEPRIGHINWAQFSKIDECIRRGMEAARLMLPELQNRMRRERFKIWKMFR